MQILAVQVLTPYVQQGLRTRVSKGVPPKKVIIFFNIGLSSVKMVADKHRYAA